MKPIPNLTSAKGGARLYHLRYSTPQFGEEVAPVANHVLLCSAASQWPTQLPCLDAREVVPGLRLLPHHAKSVCGDLNHPQQREHQKHIQPTWGVLIPQGQSMPPGLGKGLPPVTNLML